MSALSRFFLVVIITSAVFHIYSSPPVYIPSGIHSVLTALKKLDIARAEKLLPQAAQAKDIDKKHIDELTECITLYKGTILAIAGKVREDGEIPVPGLGIVKAADLNTITISVDGTSLPMKWSMLKNEEFSRLCSKSLDKEDLESHYNAQSLLLYLSYTEKTKKKIVTELKSLLRKAEKEKCNCTRILGILERLGTTPSDLRKAGAPAVRKKKKVLTPAVTPGRKTTVWRPFSDSSPWNSPIPATPVIDPGSEEMIDDMATSSQWNWLGINLTQYSIPVYFIDSTLVPKTALTNRLDKKTYQLPIPDYLKPAAGTDRHACIIDKKLMISWDFWAMEHNSDGTWKCGLYAKMDLKRTGVRTPHNKMPSPSDLICHGSRASGFPLIAGLIRPEEIKAGRIEHALVFNYPHCRAQYYVPPASTAQGENGLGAVPYRGIPMGGRIQLDPALDVEKLSLPKHGKIILTCLQEYGAYIGDYSGSIGVNLDSSEQAQEEWKKMNFSTGMFRNVIDSEMLKKFRVLKLPELIDFKKW